MRDHIIIAATFLATVAASALAVGPQAHHAAVARLKAGGGGFDKTSLVAWYDFNDTGSNGDQDSHDAGPYHLTETSSPVYQSASSPEYLDGASGNGYTVSSALDDAWGDTDTDHTLAIRCRFNSGYITNTQVLQSHGGRIFVLGNGTPTFRVRLGNIIVTTTQGITTDVWYTVFVEYEEGGATDTVNTWVGTSSTGSASGTSSFGNNDFKITQNVDIEADVDWCAVFNRHLTADERATLYNGGATIEYSDL